MKQTRPYRKSLRGRLEAVVAGLVAVMKRTGAGSIAIAIGAMGAGALLATTLIFPPTPVQKVFQSPVSGDGNETPFGRPDAVENEGTIEISTRGSGPASGSDGTSGSDDGDDDDTRVLAAALEAGEGSEVTVVSSSGGGGGVNLNEDEATPGEEPEGNTTAPSNDTEEPKKDEEVETDNPSDKAAKDEAKDDKKAEKAAEKAAKDEAKEDKKAEKAAEKAAKDEAKDDKKAEKSGDAPGKSGKAQGKNRGAIRAADARPRFD